MGLSCLFDANTPIVLNECVGIMPKNLGLLLLLSGKNFYTHKKVLPSANISFKV